MSSFLAYLSMFLPAKASEAVILLSQVLLYGSLCKLMHTSERSDRRARYEARVIVSVRTIDISLAAPSVLVPKVAGQWLWKVLGERGVKFGGRVIG